MNKPKNPAALKIGTKVITPDGPGEITGIDLPESKNKRYKILLDDNPFPFMPCYLSAEVKEQS